MFSSSDENEEQSDVEIGSDPHHYPLRLQSVFLLLMSFIFADSMNSEPEAENIDPNHSSDSSASKGPQTKRLRKPELSASARESSSRTRRTANTTRDSHTANRTASLRRSSRK